MYMHQYLKQQNPQQQFELAGSYIFSNQMGSNQISPQKKKLILVVVIILRIIIFPLDILFNRKVLDVQSILLIEFSIFLGIFIASEIIVILMNRASLNFFTVKIFAWHLLGLLNAICAASAFCFQNIVQHDHYFKIKIPLYIIEYLSLMTCLYVLLKPLNSVSRLAEQYFHPLYKCEYELSSIKYICFGAFTGGAMDCFAFGGSSNLTIFYVLCGILGVYLLSKMIAETKATSKFRFIISAQ